MSRLAWPDLPADARKFRAAGHWGDETLSAILDRLAETQPDKTYVSDGYVSLSYGMVRTQSHRLAVALLRLGFGPTDRVAVQLPNWCEFVVVYAALARIGAVLVPIIPIYRHDEVRFLLEHSGAVGLVTCGVFRKFDYLAMGSEIRESSASLRFVIRVRDRRPIETAYEDLVADRTSDGVDAGPRPTADDPHVIVYSSGTEARPKGCLHTFNTLAFLPRQAVAPMALGAGDVFFMPSPVTHTTGLTLGILTPTLVGGSIHLLDVWNPEVALERIAEYRCSATAGAATFVRMLLDAYRPGEHDVSSLRLFLTAGAPIPAPLILEAARTFGQCRIISAYGQSECLMATVSAAGDSVERVASSDGRAVEGVEVVTLDEEGKRVSVGEEGEICYRGPGLMLGYFRDPERTARSTDAQGWWHAGDLGRLDADGYLRVTGRIKDMIIRGGQNVSAREVEDHLVAHPKVAAAAVIGWPDERLGERIAAFVVPAPGDPPTLDELIAFLRDERRIARPKLPEHLTLLESMPMTASGKVQKFVLRERLRRDGRS
jgi:acyl-coenzyme A synthetase/AMP-(fatty) acid ligase